MALQKDLILDEMGGLSINGAYISIGRTFVAPSVDDEGNKVWVLKADVNVHISKEAKDAGASPVGGDHFSGEFPADQTVNPLVWVYDQLKLTDRFAGATDVIE